MMDVRRKEINEKYKQLHPDRVKETTRRANLKFTYGLSVEEYDAMLLAQDGKCAICGKEDSGSIKKGVLRRMYVDHDHITGIVRGLLCERCNLVLGNIHDDIEIARNIILYLEGRDV